MRIFHTLIRLIQVNITMHFGVQPIIWMLAVIKFVTPVITVSISSFRGQPDINMRHCIPIFLFIMRMSTKMSSIT